MARDKIVLVKENGSWKIRHVTQDIKKDDLPVPIDSVVDELQGIVVLC